MTARGASLPAWSVAGRRGADGARRASSGVVAALAAVVAALLLAVPWPLNLLLLAGLATAVVALWSPPHALGLLAASVPAQDLLDQRLGPVELRWTSAMLLGLTGAWLLRLVLVGRRPRLLWAALPFLGHVLVVAASVVAARSVPAWAAELYRWGAALLVFVVAGDVVRHAAHARPIVLGTAAGVAATSALGLAQALADRGPASFAVGGLTRAYATFGEPNPFAGYLEFAVPLLLAIAGAWVVPGTRTIVAQAFGGRLIAACAVAAVLGTVALVLTQSRGGWLGVMVGLGAVVLLIGGARWVACAVGAAAVAALLVAPVGSRVVAGAGDAFGALRREEQVTPSNFAAQERLAHWRAALRMAAARPVLGVGAGNFSHRFREFTPTWRFRVSRGHAHSTYLQAAAQTGLIGLASYLALLTTVGTRLLLLLRRAGTGAARPLVVGAVGATLALAVHGLFEYLHVLSLGIQLSLAWALAETARRAPSPPRRQPEAVAA